MFIAPKHVVPSSGSQPLRERSATFEPAERFNGGYYGGDNYSYFRLDILSNKKVGTIKIIQDPSDEGYLSGCVRATRVYRYIKQETEITDIPGYIASKIINPDRHWETTYPEP